MLVAPVLVLVLVAALPAAVVVMQLVPLLLVAVPLVLVPLLLVMVALLLAAMPWHHPGALRVWPSPTPPTANSPR